MLRSMFVSENEKTITIEGFSEKITIRPLSANEKEQSRLEDSIGSFSFLCTKVVDFGLVRVGDNKKPVEGWGAALYTDVIHTISEKILDITS